LIGFLVRLDRVPSIGRQFGNGVGEDMDVSAFRIRFISSRQGCFMEIEIDEEKVDEAVLALLYLTAFKDKTHWRAWKGHN